MIRLFLLGVLLASAPIVLAQPVPPDVVWETSINARYLAFSPDGTRLLSGGAFFGTGRLALLETADGSVASQRSITNSPINDVAYAPDGATVASAHGSVGCGGQSCSAIGPAYRTWAAASLTMLAERTDLSNATGVDFAPDDQRIAVSFFYDNDGAVRLVDAASLAPQITTPGHENVANSVRYSPDGSVFASVGDDAMLRVWDAATGEQRYAVLHGGFGFTEGGEPVSVAFSPDGALIATGGSGYLALARVWDAATGALLASYSLDVSTEAGRQYATVAFTPNGRYLVLGANEDVIPGLPESRVRFIEIATGKVAYEIDEPYMDNRGGISSVVFSPALADRFAYARDGLVKLVEVPLDLVGSSAAMTVSAAPVGGAVVIPQEGGSFAFDLELTNVSAETQTVDVWTEADGPVSYSPVIRPVALVLAPGSSVVRTVTQRVPAQAAPGVYTYTVNVGAFGESVMASDGFAVTKRGTLGGGIAEGNSADGWSATGLDVTRESSAFASASTPSAPSYTLAEAGPNPFRARTALVLTPAETQHVRAEVFDALGRRVAVLHDGPASADTPLHLVLDGSAWPPGMYVVRVAGETFSARQRLTRVR